jgi:hypothetical protein
LDITPAAFEQTVLLKCVPPGHKTMGRVWWWFNRRFFKADLELIRAAGDCTSTQDVFAELSDHRYHHPNRGFVRNILRLRLSGKRLMRFASRCLRA